MSQITNFGGSSSPTPPSTLLNYTNVTTNPYIVLTTDQFLGVSTGSIAITVQLPAAPPIGKRMGN